MVDGVASLRDRDAVSKSPPQKTRAAVENLIILSWLIVPACLRGVVLAVATLWPSAAVCDGRELSTTCGANHNLAVSYMHYALSKSLPAR
eukprot:scaffold28127_cov139-Skeletonema_dohrnii-CCMP3373.AAC.5